MLTPIELIKATVDKMAERGFGRVVNITSGSVKAPIDVLGLSNGARSGLTGFVAGSRAASSPRAASPSTACCRALRHRPLRATMQGAVAKTGKSIEPSPTSASGRSRRSASAAPRSSARCAHSCAASTPATSRLRTILADGGAYPGTF
jgi:3-oxoacyl-[acyl-carrier protein] reductase